MNLSSAILKWQRLRLLRLYFDSKISNLIDSCVEFEWVKLSFVLIRFYDQSHDHERIKLLFKCIMMNGNSKYASFNAFFQSSKNEKITKMIINSLVDIAIARFIDNISDIEMQTIHFTFLNILLDTTESDADGRDYIHQLQMSLLNSFYENASCKLLLAIKRVRNISCKDGQTHLHLNLKARIHDFLTIAFLPMVDNPYAIMFCNKFYRHILTIPFFMSSLNDNSVNLIKDKNLFYLLEDRLMDYLPVMYTQSGEESLFFIVNMAVYISRMASDQPDDELTQQNYLENVFLPIIMPLINHCQGFLRDQKSNHRCVFHHYFKVSVWLH